MPGALRDGYVAGGHPGYLLAMGEAGGREGTRARWGDQGRRSGNNGARRTGSAIGVAVMEVSGAGRSDVVSERAAAAATGRERWRRLSEGNGRRWSMFGSKNDGSLSWALEASDAR